MPTKRDEDNKDDHQNASFYHLELHNPESDYFLIPIVIHGEIWIYYYKREASQ